MAKRREQVGLAGTLAGCPAVILDAGAPLWRDDVRWRVWMSRRGWTLDARSRFDQPVSPSIRRRQAAYQWAFDRFGPGRDLHGLRAAGLPI